MKPKQLPASPTIEGTLLAALEPNLAPRDLLQAVRRVHPEATKREIMTAAFAAMILLADKDPDRARTLHDLAIRSRGA